MERLRPRPPAINCTTVQISEPTGALQRCQGGQLGHVPEENEGHNYIMHTKLQQTSFVASRSLRRPISGQPHGRFTLQLLNTAQPLVACSQAARLPSTTSLRRPRQDLTEKLLYGDAFIKSLFKLPRWFANHETILHFTSDAFHTTLF
jgi:hypothetical protein